MAGVTWDGKGLGAIEPAGDEAAVAVVNAIIAKGQELISTNLQTVTDSAGHRGREDTGAAGQALAIEPARKVGRKVVGWVIVQPPADEYWPVIEGGRRPGKAVSLAGRLKISRWVKRKLGRGAAEGLIGGLTQRVSSRRLAVAGRGGKLRRISKADRERAMDALTFLVVRKIREKGIPGIQPFGRAARTLRGGEARRLARRTVRTFRRRIR